ncbi:MAG: hypothetical protein ABFS35_06170 [Bacteroidota bacterium]
MKNWVKLESFGRLHQAELRKDLLEMNGVPSVIINEKDSLFLLGEIELFVKKFDEAKARELIDEFRGLTKINSFVGEKQMELFREILLHNNIHSVIKKKEEDKYVLDNYEVYVNNEDIEEIVGFMQNKLLDQWEKLRSFHRVRQTKYHTDILDENKIDNFIVKRKDSAYHLESVEVFVKKDNIEKSTVLLNKLNGWISVRKYSERHWADIDEDILNENNIKGLIAETPEGFEILVEASNEEAAIDIINMQKDWTVLKTYKSIENAKVAKRVLAKNEINSVIVNEKDSSFLIGELELYVEIDRKQIAETILKDF